MYFNVIIHEYEDCMQGNYLIFYFGNNLEEAKNFSEQILKISDYYVEIIPVLEDKKEE
jgi:hypothetical protein